jgi:hypothetical protein
MTEQADKPKHKKRLTKQHKNFVRFSYEVLAGMYNPAWVKTASEDVQRAYLAGQQMALKECAEAMFGGSTVFNPDIWKTRLHEYAKEVGDPRLNR